MHWHAVSVRFGEQHQHPQDATTGHSWPIISLIRSGRWPIPSHFVTLPAPFSLPCRGSFQKLRHDWPRIQFGSCSIDMDYVALQAGAPRDLHRGTHAELWKIWQRFKGTFLSLSCICRPTLWPTYIPVCIKNLSEVCHYVLCSKKYCCQGTMHKDHWLSV